jgi:hypothetical protein
MKIEGHDNAILGPALLWNANMENSRVEVLVYDAEIIRFNLMKQGMTSEEAREFIEFNIEGAYLGPDTPILVWPEDVWSFDD